MSYSATARLEDEWWIVDVDGVGVTQARSVGEAYRMASDLVYAITDVKGAEVDLRFIGGVFDDIEPLRQMQDRAESMMVQASSEMRQLVAKLLEAGLKGSDIAHVLKVSRQRASQLTKSATVRPESVDSKGSVPLRSKQVLKQSRGGSRKSTAITEKAKTKKAVKHN